MFPFWRDVIEPLIKAAHARRIVEIGALRGETTVKLLRDLGPDAELHVIDPVPEFDPGEHERRFPGRYVFYRDLSLNVLPDLPPVDVALIDGDHNWYTVYHELAALSSTAKKAGAALPVMIMHDVCWPYGRRDLYYAPETIPEEHRQPYAQRGINREHRELLPPDRLGLNRQLHNALYEGGPHNGVMTALDDFIAEHDRPVRRIVIPIYWGLAIVADEERLAEHPELGRMLDEIESLEGHERMLELAEGLRIKDTLFTNNLIVQEGRRLEHAADRYLDLLARALIDEIYLENELRIDHLARCVENRRPLDERKVRDPVRYMRDEYRRLLAERQTGKVGSTDGRFPSYFPYTTMGRTRLDHLRHSLEEVRSEAVPGDLVECGTGRGGGAIFMRGFLDVHGVDDVRVFVVDRFHASTNGSSEASGSLPGGGRGFPNLHADLNAIRDGFERFGLFDDRVRFLQGAYGDTLPDAPIEKIALLRIGGGVGDAEIGGILDTLYDRIAIGGRVIVDDYDNPESARAIDAFRARRGVDDLLERTSWAGVTWCKRSEPRSAQSAQLPERAHRAPLAPAVAESGSCDLSVVVVFYNMRREAARTLHSLSRAYQRDVEDLDYEIVVLENGSADDQKLGEEYVRGFGPEFRYVDIGDKAPPTPVDALNRGIAIARGEALALMIDGAHVLTPGVLRWGTEGLRSFRSAIVATQQWYVGPGEQPHVIAQGYDQAFENRLFDKIAWPTDGYRLFDIGTFCGDRDWFDGIWESNCLFVSRRLLEQVGGFDESWTVPGGGYANLEIYERLAASPDVAVATLLGEGSFHQVHGGTTTNLAAADERHDEIGGYTKQFNAMRGRAFQGPGKPIHYIGRMFPSARRTRARYRVAPELFKAGAPDPDTLPDEPVPLPKELTTAFIDGYWHSPGWREARWLGEEVHQPPTDLFVYQEIISEVRPDWIIAIGPDSGGRALFLASLCELVGHGQVLSVGPAPERETVEHPRINRLAVNSVTPEAANQVREIVGDEPNALVVLGSKGSRPRITREFELYSPLVAIGSYVIVEDTIVNGNPVWPGYGPGPAEAVRAIMSMRGNFTADPTREKHGLTFNPGGFLKRLR